jgi:chromosome segregation ATPase
MDLFANTYQYLVRRLSQPGLQRNYLVQEQAQPQVPMPPPIPIPPPNDELRQRTLELLALRRNYEVLVNRVNSLELDLGEHRAARQGLEVELRQARQSIEDMTRQQRRDRENLNRAADDRATTEADLRRANEQTVRNRDEQFNRYQQEITALRAETTQRMNERRLEAESHARELASANRRINELEASLASVQARTSAQERDLLRDERVLQVEGLHSLEAKLKRVETVSDERAQKIEELSKTLAADNRNFNTQREIQELEKNELLRQLTEQTRRTEDYRSLNDFNLSKVGVLELENNKLKEKGRELSETINRLMVLDAASKNASFAQRRNPFPTGMQ